LGRTWQRETAYPPTSSSKQGLKPNKKAGGKRKERKVHTVDLKRGEMIRLFLWTGGCAPRGEEYLRGRTGKKTGDDTSLPENRVPGKGTRDLVPRSGQKEARVRREAPILSPLGAGEVGKENVEVFKGQIAYWYQKKENKEGLKRLEILGYSETCIAFKRGASMEIGIQKVHNGDRRPRHRKTMRKKGIGGKQPPKPTPQKPRRGGSARPRESGKV